MSNVMIGFNPTGDIVEARRGAQARLLSPNVFFTPAYISNLTDKEIKLPTSPFPELDHDLFFREDSFEPITRIRRGRFYKKRNSSHSDFFINPQVGDTRSLPAIHSLNWDELGGSISKRRVHLGLRNANTVLSLVQAESITTGEMLITLKAVSYLGVLPDLNESLLPEAHRKNILEKVSKVAQDFYVATPSAIIELARDAGSAVMSAVVMQNGLSEKLTDLGEAAKLFLEHSGAEKKVTQYNVGHCAKILANLHNQNKSVEQLKNEHRSIEESDAEIAVKCFAQMVRDLEWAKP